MVNHDPINSILDNLEKDDEKFIIYMDKLIKEGVKIFNATEELQEELMGYDDIYQTYISDVDFNYWFKITKGKIEYQKGINPDALFKVNYTKDLIIKILKGDIGGTDAFMKGKIMIEGNLSQGLRYVKLYRIFFKYLKRKNGNNRLN